MYMRWREKECLCIWPLLLLCLSAEWLQWQKGVDSLITVWITFFDFFLKLQNEQVCYSDIPETHL